MRKIIQLFIFFSCIGFRVAGQTADYSSVGSYKVNVLEFKTLTDSSRAFRNVPVKIHYPTEKGVFPVIIMSHGAGGNWDTHYGIAQHLASHGYIVLCLEHVGSNTVVLKKSIRLMKNVRGMIHDSNEVVSRPKDITFAIDQIKKWNLTHPLLKGEFDEQNIGVLGHSFGAFTSMVIAGIQPTLDNIKNAGQPKYGLVSGLNDDRVKCCVALSPQGAHPPFFSIESFKTLHRPLLGISGTKDKLTGGYPAIDRYNSFEYWPSGNGNHRFVWIENAAHNDFSDNEGSGTQNFYSPNRKYVSKIVRAASLLFFDFHLKKIPTAKKYLSTEGLNPYLTGVINKLEVRSK